MTKNRGFRWAGKRGATLLAARSKTETPRNPSGSHLCVVLCLSCFLISASALEANVRINEVMASNGETIADEYGEFEDWIELYNPTGTLVDLSGWGLSDNYDQPFKWTFPEGTTLQAGDYLLIWASGRDTNLHANFSISSSGEEIILTMPDGTRVDELPPTPIPRDVSLGRVEGEGTAWFYFAEPTPGSANTTPHVVEFIERPPAFSHGAGFYPAPIDLYISHPDPDVTIYYTLDGSTPDPANLAGRTYRYKNRYPRNVGDTTLGPLLSRQIRTHTYTNFITLMNRSPSPYRLAAINTEFTYATTRPQANIPKATVVRAVAHKTNAIPSASSTRTFFIEETIRPDNILPIISITTDERNLFDYYSGLYVPGTVADDWRRNNPQSVWNGASAANYNRRGPDWERPAHFEYFSSDRMPRISQDIGIRIHGGWSRQQPQKSLRLYPRPRYDDVDSLRYPFFPDLHKRGNASERLYHFRRLLLRNSGQDWYQTLYRDAFMQALVDHLPLDTQAYQPAIHFINGEFWGIINIRERLDADYIQGHYDISEEAIAILGGQNATLDTGIPSDRTDFLDIVAYAEQNNLAQSSHFDWIAQRVDTENLAAYYAAQIIVNNQDWPQNNIAWWRKRTEQYEPDALTGYDGRWRWLLYDTDWGFGYRGDHTVNSLARVVHLPANAIRVERVAAARVNRLFRALVLENAGFRHHFINQMADLMNTTFRSAHILQTLDEFEARIQPYRSLHNRRWNHTTGPQAIMRTFATERPAHMRSHIQSVFNLSGTANLTVQNTSPHHGTVQVNTLKIETATPGIRNPHAPYPWTGTYFQNVPVTLTAQSRERGRFIHWLVNPANQSITTNNNSTIQLPMTAHTTVTAVFEEIPLREKWLVMHEWDFESPTDYLEPSFTVGNAELTTTLGGNTEIVRNDAAQDFDTAHLRVNNPLGSSLTFALPTTDYEAVQLQYETRRSGQGAGLQTISFTTDGSTWTDLATYEVENAPPQTHSFDFSTYSESDDNPLFAIRITFAQGDGGTAGNNRFDNLTLTGVPLPSVSLPPVLINPIPLQKLIEHAPSTTIPLNDHFADPNNTPLDYTAVTEADGIVTATINSSTLSVAPHKRGQTTITVTADDGENTPVSTTFRVLVYPEAHPLVNGPYTFDNWAPDQPAGTFPPNMIFLQSEESDTELDTPLLHAYHIPEEDAADPEDVDFPYSATSRTRITGHNEDGISFINTGRGRDLGGALLALDTRHIDHVPIQWLAGTITPNSRIYAIRLQYRVGAHGPFHDLLDKDLNPVEYIRDPAPGHTRQMPTTALPPDALGQEYVQILWRYHHLSVNSGPRAQLRLDNISVAATPQIEVISAPAIWQSGRTMTPIAIRFLDHQGNTDTSSKAPVSIEAIGSDLSGPLRIKSPTTGIVTFHGLTSSGIGVLLNVTTPGSAPTIIPISLVHLTERHIPLYMQGEQDADGNNLNRVPYAYRVRLDGLAPNTTYRYGNRVVLPDEPPLTSSGAGNMLFVKTNGADFIRNTSSPRFRPEDLDSRHSEFTTDTAGVYEGWFITEPSGNERFTPGNQLAMRIILNDGQDGEDHHLALDTDSTATVLEFGQAAHQGTPAMGHTEADPRQFVLLYDNITGSGRPIAATPVEITGAEVDERYATFYQTSVAPFPHHWGTIIPNNLPQGIRRAEQRHLETGALLATTTHHEGFPGTTQRHLHPPFSLQAVALTNSVMLRWTWPEHLQAPNRYAHIRSSTDTYPDTLTCGEPVATTTDDRYWDTDLDNHITYYYTLWLSSDGENWRDPDDVVIEIP